MAPSRTSSKAKSPNTTPLKQAKLPFGATKRTASSSSVAGKPKKAVKAPTVREVSEERHSISSSSEDETDVPLAVVGTKKRVQVEKAAPIDVEVYREDLEAFEKSTRLRKHWRLVQKQRGTPVGKCVVF